MFKRKFIGLFAIITVLVAGFSFTAKPVKAAASLLGIEASCSSVSITFETDINYTFIHAGVVNADTLSIKTD